ncbi:MAG: hypothetical protein F6K26_57045 [Moorea sp. SIO2I5]|nr:hypothetical protein [Moorena sp. SIO2I5]
MIDDPQILVFPYFLETKPEVFSIEDLQDLDQTLARLQNNPPENIEEILINWFKARLKIRDKLIEFDDICRKELGKVPPTPPIQPDRLAIRPFKVGINRDLSVQIRHGHLASARVELEYRTQT